MSDDSLKLIETNSHNSCENEYVTEKINIRVSIEVNHRQEEFLEV